MDCEILSQSIGTFTHETSMRCKIYGVTIAVRFVGADGWVPED